MDEGFGLILIAEKSLLVEPYFRHTITIFICIFRMLVIGVESLPV